LFIFINASLFPQYNIELKNHISLYAITYAKTMFRTDGFHYLSKGFFAAAGNDESCLPVH
ncbi:hypothetical protein Q4S30_19920, partial [Morganella morganii]